MSYLDTVREPVKVSRANGRVNINMSPEKFDFVQHYVAYSYITWAAVLLVGTTWAAVNWLVPKSEK